MNPIIPHAMRQNGSLYHLIFTKAKVCSTFKRMFNFLNYMRMHILCGYAGQFFFVICKVNFKF